ncbi:MAG: CPBP family intramembrane metalloprotease [Clostridiales Family XIII bacterium]|jgi:membrane protease YdiL (CAAX protease family)|nr:CPBP family intramembrane metalloprotease [Clostridiales Family XIII bacterium]
MDLSSQNQNVYGGFDWKLFNRDVRRDVCNCVLFLAFFYAVNLAASFIIEAVFLFRDPAFLALMSDPSSLGGIFSGDLSASGWESYTDAVMNTQSGPMPALISIISTVAGGCVFLIYRKRRFFTDLALPAAERMTPAIFIILVVATQGFQCVYGLLVALADSLLPEGLSLADSYSSALDILLTPLGLLYIVLVGPLFEELIFRGAVIGSLRRFGDNFAILFSALLFGLYHMLIMQIPFAFVMGLLLGYVAVRWSLRFSVLLHIIVNGLSVLFSDIDNTALQTAGGLAMVICAFATLILAIALRWRLRTRISLGAAYYPHTYANGFSSIAFWAFAVIMTAIGLLQINMAS